MRALYEIELGHAEVADALRITLEEAKLAPDIAAYAERLIVGSRKCLPDLDRALASLIHDYDFMRIAAVDRNVLRVAAYELFEVPEIPPAVTIDEAIEIAKRYSTAESGKFVNGVLGQLLKQSPKATWDPALAPPEGDEPIIEDPEPEIEEIVVQEGSKEADFAAKYGTWKLRSGEREIPPNTENI